MDNDDHIQGYFDGRDLGTPWPSGNRSHVYRHCFEVGRREKMGCHWPAEVARQRAAAAYIADGLPVPEMPRGRPA
tara:strand:+ start:1947 stop:2171 length:225 start_codon:yes stop_codon:yes gene_type:complete